MHMHLKLIKIECVNICVVFIIQKRGTKTFIILNQLKLDIQRGGETSLKTINLFNSYTFICI